MNAHPLVSIILPTYNRKHLLTRAIQSVQEQNYTNFELIIVDDGSKDNTWEVIKNFQDSRIHYLRHEANYGAAAARNIGVKASHGNFIAFQDSDDEWLPDK